MEGDRTVEDSTNCRPPAVSHPAEDECPASDVPKCHPMEQLQLDISQVTLNNSEQQPSTVRAGAAAAAEDDDDSAGAASLEPRKCVLETSVIEVMLGRISSCDAHFRHQQRGEPDLTLEEKYCIAKDLFETKPTVFLSRYGKYLTEEDLSCFTPLKEDYAVDFHLKEIKRQLDDRKNQTKIRNRRYEAMKELLSKGDYFSDDEMKRRDPLLYDQMVGRFLTDDEIAAEIDRTDLRFSNILLKHIQVQQNRALYEHQRDMEDNQMEEEDEDDEEEEEEMEGSECGEELGDGRVKLPDAERLMLRSEFTRTMQLRFLNGDDAEFNYSEVDDNVEYDSVDIRTQDEEEKYFDEQEPETAESQDSDSMTQMECPLPDSLTPMGCPLPDNMTQMECPLPDSDTASRAPTVESAKSEKV